MEKLSVLACAALLFAGITASSHAQEVAPNGAVDPGHPRVNEVDRRQRRQDRRIAEGERSGELTNHETAKVDRQENGIQRAKARDMAGDDGHLTKREKRHLNRRQDEVSDDIHRDKHNDEKK